jgi:hypothetical protein
LRKSTLSDDGKGFPTPDFILESVAKLKGFGSVRLGGLTTGGVIFSVFEERILKATSNFKPEHKSCINCEH